MQTAVTNMVDVTVGMRISHADDWHSIEDALWPIPEKEFILAHYIAGPIITINSNYVRANIRHFDKWRPIPAIS
jgi:hypothetical protein